MALFERKEKRHQHRKVKTYKEVIASAIKKELRNNPALLRKAALKEFGLLDLADIDEVQKAKNKFRVSLITQAYELIQSDPKLMRIMVRRQAEELLGEPLEPKNGVVERTDPVSEILDHIDEVDAIKERLGVGTGGLLASVLNKEVIQKLLDIILMKMGAGQVSLQKMVVVNEAGQSVEVPESDFQQLIKDGKVTPVATLIEAGASAKAESMTQGGAEPPCLPPFVRPLDFKLIANYLSMPPDKVAEVMNAAPDPTLGMLRAYLMNATVEDIITKLTPYRDHSKIGRDIEHLLSDEGKLWLAEVLSLLQAKNDGIRP